MSKGKKKTTSTGTSSTTQTLNPWSQGQYTDQVGRVRGLLDASPVEAYSGRTQADFGGLADQYMNPFQQEVIDTTMADITRMNEGQNAAARGRAAASGAYGGSGVAVAEAGPGCSPRRSMKTRMVPAGIVAPLFVTVKPVAPATKLRSVRRSVVPIKM
jgi:hypothetical protein